MTGLWLASYIVLWALVLLNLLLVIALARRTAHLPVFKTIETLTIGMPAPPLTARSFREGKEVDLETYLGREVTFIFVGEHCQSCHDIMPMLLEKVTPMARQSGVELVLVSESDVADIRPFVEKFQITLPVLLAPRSESRFFEDYKVPGTPFFCLVDNQGVVKATGYLETNLKNLTAHFRSTGRKEVMEGALTPST